MTPIAGMTLRTATARQCAVEQWLGSSGRGEVYQMRGDRQPAAPHLRERRQGAIENGALDNHLRCSLSPVISPNGRTCGCLWDTQQQTCCTIQHRTCSNGGSRAM